MRVQVETNYPRPCHQVGKTVRVRGQTGQALLQLPDYRVQVVEEPVRELFFAEFIPHMFLGGQFRRIGRQRQQADIVRDDQGLGLVRTRAVPSR